MLILLVRRHPYQVWSGIIVEGIQHQGIDSGKLGLRRARLLPTGKQHIRTGLTVGEEAVLPKDGVQGRLQERPALRSTNVIDPGERNPLAAAMISPWRSIITKAHPHLINCR